MSNRQHLYFMVRKQTRGDGISFWLWEILDRQGWTLISGTVYGERALAVEKAQRTIIAFESGAPTLRVH
jgi:hypothetical protein